MVSFDCKVGMIEKKRLSMVLAIVTMVILLGSAVGSPTLSAYADKGDDKGKSHGDNDNNQSHGDHDDHHKKGKKDPDKDKDNDRKACKSGDKNKNGKYEHVNDKYERNCDSDHDFKK